MVGLGRQVAGTPGGQDRAASRAGGTRGLFAGALQARRPAAKVAEKPDSAAAVALPPPDKDGVTDLMPRKYYVTEFLARDDDSHVQMGDMPGPNAMRSVFSFAVREVAGKLYFGGPGAPPDPLKVSVIEKVDLPTVDFFHSPRGLLIGCRDGGKERPAGVVRDWAIDWRADPPAVVYADQPRQAAVWTWESREQKAEYSSVDAAPLPVSQGDVLHHPRRARPRLLSRAGSYAGVSR